ncbi:type II secretion system protein GspH [Ideonella paludis]|uniref:Type II secretion system protein GspH n=2 Tax=Ideonella paludis TaxID=1233411 RepID=A0ABS5DW95_9BURK|nr:type II secretion system protein GspH [Ideonella paludis]
MMVVAMLAVVASMAALALRDGNASKLEEEAARLAALLEGARAHSRTQGSEVRWQARAAEGDQPSGFVFTGLSEKTQMPKNWLDARTQGQVVGAPLLRLGPEPFIGAQRVLLRLEDRQLLLATDGMGPFTVVLEPEPGKLLQP